MELLEADGVEVDERRFKSSAGINGLSEPFVCIAIIYCYSTYIILNSDYTIQ